MDPLASSRSHLRWQRDKVPCTSALQGDNLLKHAALPVGVDNSLSVSGWLNKRSSEAIVIRRMDSIMVTKSIPRGRLKRRSNKRGRGRRRSWAATINMSEGTRR